mgnify:CR=1 FL=1
MHVSGLTAHDGEKSSINKKKVCGKMPGAFLYEPNSGILDMNYESSYESIRLRRGKLVKNKKSILRKLFFSCLYLSTFTFGGGYVIVTLMKKKFVDDYQWIDEKEMLDLVAIAQSSPGPIAVNGAIVVGYKLEGFLGAMTAILGTIIPPFLIISVISVGYHSFSDSYFISQILEGMQAGVAAVILDAACSLGESVLKEKSSLSIFIMTAAFVCDFFLGVNVVYIILVAACIGIIQFIWHQYKPFFLKQTQK